MLYHLILGTINNEIFNYRVVCECGHLRFTGNVPQGHNFVIRETGYVCVITGEKTTMNRAVDSEEKYQIFIMAVLRLYILFS